MHRTVCLSLLWLRACLASFGLHRATGSGTMSCDMSFRPGTLSELLRLAVVGVTVCVALLGRESLVQHPTRGVADLADSTDGERWLLRMGGWFVRVDGAVVEVPSLAEQIRPLIMIREPEPLSPYDHLIIRHSEEQGLDWRLVAALIFEESRFVPDAVSEQGAYGLMQVRPIAAAEVGERRFTAPSDNIRAGSRYLKHLEEIFSEARGWDRLALVLAAYNMGPGHVQDAQTLARRFGYNPRSWADSMDLVLPLLEEPAVYEQLPGGYAQGRLVVNYVNRVLERYEAYRRQF